MSLSGGDAPSQRPEGRRERPAVAFRVLVRVEGRAQDGIWRASTVSDAGSRRTREGVFSLAESPGRARTSRCWTRQAARSPTCLGPAGPQTGISQTCDEGARGCSGWKHPTRTEREQRPRPSCSTCCGARDTPSLSLPASGRGGAHRWTPR